MHIIMAIFIDPQTRQRIVYDQYSGDLVYDLVGDTAITKETIPVIGDWEDYTGSAVVNSKAQQQWAGTSNELDGTDPAIEGHRVGNLGEVGQNTQTTRRRRIKRRVHFNKTKTGTNAKIYDIKHGN